MCICRALATAASCRCLTTFTVSSTNGTTSHTEATCRATTSSSRPGRVCGRQGTKAASAAPSVNPRKVVWFVATMATCNQPSTRGTWSNGSSSTSFAAIVAVPALQVPQRPAVLQLPAQWRRHRRCLLGYGIWNGAILGVWNGDRHHHGCLAVE